MKYVFLDIDGVVNSSEFFSREKPLEQFNGLKEVSDFDLGLAHLCPGLVSRLNLLADDGVAFVLSSTWRMKYPLHHVQTMLVHKGFRGRLIGATPVSMGTRGREIAMWIESATGAPIFDRVRKGEWPDFVILDDDSDMLHLGWHLVKTESNVGLQDGDVALARRVLGLDN